MVRKRTFTNRRRIVAQLAISADGYIARTDGGIDWLDRPMPKGAYGLGRFFASIDTVLWGRTTFDEAMARGHYGGPGGFTAKMKNYVFTHHPPAEGPKGVEFVNEPVPDFARRLRATPGKDIWMMGGGGIIATFLDAGELDDVVLAVIPTFIGEGIPLIAPARRTVPLTLVGSKAFSDGVVRLHYRCRNVGQGLQR